jgi:translation initiation factor 1
LLVRGLAQTAGEQRRRDDQRERGEAWGARPHGAPEGSRRYDAAVTTKKPDAPANPFAKLAALRDDLPAGPSPSPTTSPGAKTPAAKPGPARAVVRYERKGRGGKEVTIVDKLELKAAELEAWAKALKQALGTGGMVEGDTIVLQGDVRPRIEAVLIARGVRKITIA